MSSFDLNKAMLIGNVGKTPEKVDFSNGGSVVKFTLATNESWKDKSSGEYVTKTDWHNIVCFNDFVGKAIMNNVTVGTKVYVEGECKTRKYNQDGTDRWITEIVIPKFSGDMKVLIRGTEDVDDSMAGNPEPAADAPFKDDIPF